MLPADRYRVLDPGEVSACSWCGARPRGSNEQNPDLTFIAVNVTADEEIVPPGLIMTVHDQPARRIYAAKDGYGRGTGAIVQEHVTTCSECVQRVAELAGYGDLLPVQAQLEERDTELAGTRQRLQETLQRAEEAEEALKATAAFQRLLYSAPEVPRKPAKAKAA